MVGETSNKMLHIKIFYRRKRHRSTDPFLLSFKFLFHRKKEIFVTVIIHTGRRLNEKLYIYTTDLSHRFFLLASPLYEKIALWNSQPLLYSVISRNTSLLVLYKFPLINNFRVASPDGVFQRPSSDETRKIVFIFRWSSTW